MKNMTSIICFSLAIGLCSHTLVPAVSAVPTVQDKDKDELEKLILRKIEEKKREKEAARKSGKSPSSSSTNSFGKTKTTPAVKATPPRAGTSKRSPRANTVDASGSSSVAAPARVRPTNKDPEYTKPTEMVIPNPSNIDPNVKITFSFQDEEWKDIIEWFAEELGYGLFYGQTGPPTGTHTYIDPNEYTLIEALDKLNSWLALMQPSHVLVRNGNLLILINESGLIPEAILPFVTPDELSQYSQYEVVRCKFDLGDSSDNLNALVTQLRENVSDVHLDGFVFVEAANELIIRERVRVLREINATINKSIKPPSPISSFKFNHADPETALVTARQMMGIAENAGQLDDGSLRFSLSLADETIYITGTSEKVSKFTEILRVLDVPISEGVNSDGAPYFKKHGVSGDTAVVYQIVQTILDGEPDVRMDQDGVTGDVYILGPERIHKRVEELLTSMAGGDTFDIVPVNNGRPSDIVDTVEELKGIDSFSDEGSNDPRLIADSDNDRILVYGTPQQRMEIRKMIEMLDEEKAGDSKTRRRTRIIRMSPRDADNVVNYLQIDGLMDTLGRKNRLKIILPQDRQNYLNRNRMRPLEQQPTESNTRGDGIRNGSGSTNRRIFQKTSVVVGPRQYYASTFVQEDDNSQLGTVTGADDTTQPEINVPGADISVRLVEQGIVITTDDLDAGDELEELIDDIIGEEGAPEFPVFIGIEHRDANEIKGLLEHILGISSSSGGGGGSGLMNLVGGAVSNAVGGGAGDALSGLLGGGDSGGFGDDSAGAIELEGENVSITVDGRSNTLIVVGATSNDLDWIIELVDIVDVDSPAHRPNLSGDTFIIPIKYRDPMDIKEMVQEMYPELIKNAQGSANANRQQQNPEQAIQRAIVQQLQRGGGRGGRGANAAAGGNNGSEAPKATLGIDEENRSLLLTGPKSIYEKVVALVDQLDIKIPTKTDYVPITKMSPNAVVEILKDSFGDQVTVIVGDEESDGSSSGSGARGNTGGRAGNSGRSSTPSSTQLQRSIMDQLRSRGGGNRGGNARGRGR